MAARHFFILGQHFANDKLALGYICQNDASAWVAGVDFLKFLFHKLIGITHQSHSLELTVGSCGFAALDSGPPLYVSPHTALSVFSQC